MALIFQNAFFLLANTSFEHDCTIRSLLLVLQFFTSFRNRWKVHWPKHFFPRESVSLLTYLLSKFTLSLFPLAVTWNFTSTLKKMKHLALFTTQDIFFMNYYLKIAHILSKRTAMKAHKIKWKFVIICGFSLGCESNPLSPKLLIFFLCFSSSDAS